MSYNKYAVCCITNYQLDHDYIEEWCKHYFSIGFDVIYLMDDAKDQQHLLSEIPSVANYISEGKIFYIKRLDHPIQHGLYDAFYKEHKNEFEWCGFFDSDEFLSFNHHDTIDEFINDKKLNFSDTDSIQICWRNYGDNDKLYKEDAPVQERFTIVSPLTKKDGTIETKVIVHGGLDNVTFFIGHYAFSNKKLNKVKFCDGSIIGKETPFHKADYSVAAIEHYYTKSAEEFAERKSHGRLDILDRPADKCYSEFKKAFFEQNKWTQEKENIFNDVKHRHFPKKNVIYTVITNDYDDLKTPKIVDDDFDYICFSNSISGYNPVWEVHELPQSAQNNDDFLKNRLVKICPHLFLQNYELSVYIDGNGQIVNSIKNLIEEIAADKFYLSIKAHPLRNCIYKELESCLKLHLVDEAQFNSLQNFLNAENYPHNLGLSENNIIIRHHNDTKCAELMEQWFNLLKKQTTRTRDQFFLYYLLWKNDAIKETNIFKYNLCPWETTDLDKKQCYVIFHAHKQHEIITKIYSTYYKPEQEARIVHNSNVIAYNTNNSEFVDNVLNKYWSEYIVMKNIWKQGKKFDYIGFDQYDVHFPYDDIEHILSADRVIFYSKMPVSSIRRQFAICHGNIELDTAIDIINRQYGMANKYSDYLNNGTTFYYKSCFIMSWDNYNKMCTFLFGILDEMDKQYGLDFNPEKYKILYEKRIADGMYKNTLMKSFDGQCRGFGFLAERLLSAWLWVNIPHENIITIKDGAYKKYITPQSNKHKDIQPPANIQPPSKKIWKAPSTVMRKQPVNRISIIRSLYNRY